MSDFGYTARSRAVNEAQAEVHAAFNELVNRYDKDDPRTKRWLDAIAAFRDAHALVYPDGLQLVEEGVLPASAIDTAQILDFLEADPVFFRSGYMKETVLGALKQRKLASGEAERLRRIIIDVTRKNDRREFRRYCRAAIAVDCKAFRQEIESLQNADDPNVRRRADWVLDALEHASDNEPIPDL